MDVVDVDNERRCGEILDEIRAEFPDVRILYKRDSLLQRSIAAGLAAVTLGAERRYLTEFVTTIGRSIYLPDTWDERAAWWRYMRLRHERVHLRQFRRWTLPVMGILYLLFPLPLGLAWARMRFERPAYEETIRAAYQARGIDYVRGELRDEVVGRFVSGAYGWMWPFRRAVLRWYDGVIATLGPPEEGGARL